MQGTCRYVSSFFFYFFLLPPILLALQRKMISLNYKSRYK